MPRISFDDAEKYSASHGGFFGLADDGDKAVVRFYHKDINDIELIPVHNVTVGDKSRKVECLRTPDEPKSKCPFCQAGMGVSVRVFLKVFEYTPDKDGYYNALPACKIWERGSGIRKQLQSLVNRYGKNGFYNKIFEIERCGKKGDTKTTYQIYPVDDLREDECPFPEDEDINFPEVLNGIVLSRNYEDMEYYLDNNEFPKQEQKENRATSTNRVNDDSSINADTEEDSMPIGRRRAISEQPHSDADIPPRRRRV